jgi:serine/threonine-protein kinase RsbW
LVHLSMRLHHSPGQIRVHFTDDGPPVDIDLQCAELPDEMAERGRGLALAQSVLSALTYDRDETGNHWLLVSQPF